VAAPKEATLVVWSPAITVFRSSFAGLNAQERAAQAAERIQALPLGSESAEIKVEPVKIVAEEGEAFKINSNPVFFRAAGDLAADSNQTLNAEAQAAVTALRAGGWVTPVVVGGRSPGPLRFRFQRHCCRVDETVGRSV
jgi:hypothetical protein